jgi:transketolase
MSIDIEADVIQSLVEKAKKMRREIIKMIYNAQSGHPGGSLSAIDIITALYFKVMNIRPAEPNWEDRDRFILSKGHACPALYAVLAEKSFYDYEETKTLRAIDSKLQGHPDMKKLPGLDATSGSLGQGLSLGLGMALVGKLDKKAYKIYVMLGDGETQEGQVWEAAMAAAKYKLDNLIVFVDKNNLQVDGFVNNIMPIDPLADKWQAFNWDVQEIDGHNMQEILEAIANTNKTRNRPHVIIANTIKGKGVSYMENVAVWHGKAPNDEEFNLAMQQLGGMD